MAALAVEWLGLVPYTEALEIQARAARDRREGRTPDRLLLLEHPAVVTLGRSSHAEHLLLSREEFAARGIELHEVGRGGDVTFHAPGQLVGYPIVELAARGPDETPDVHRYLRDLEAVLCEALFDLGLPATTRPGITGVFVAPVAREAPGPPRKLASIGVGVRHWVTLHGFALNVDLDLAGFDVIVPCGLHEVEMTSVARELAGAAPPDLALRAREAVARAFARRFGD